MVKICWTCSCGELENTHHDPRAIVTADLQAAANQAGVALPRAVGNIVMSLSHYDPDRVNADGTAKGVEAMDIVEQLEAEAVLKGIETVEDFLSAVWHDRLTKAAGVDDVIVLEKAGSEEQYLLMVVYDPHRMPLRGADKMVDLASPEVLEKACWRFMENGARGGLNHRPGNDGAIKFVENYIYRNPVPWDVHGDGSLVVKAGTWLAGAKLDDATWADYKAGRYAGVSMQGGARRMPASEKSLARVRGDSA